MGLLESNSSYSSKSDVSPGTALLLQSSLCTISASPGSAGTPLTSSH